MAHRNTKRGTSLCAFSNGSILPQHKLVMGSERIPSKQQRGFIKVVIK